PAALSFFVLSLYSTPYHPSLHSFPTRRSSDLTGDRQVLAKIEFFTEFGDQFLTGKNHRFLRRSAKPVCQAIFSHGKARGGKQLEQTALAKHVEVFGIDMLVSAKPVPALPCSDPAVFDAIHSPAVIVCGG